jgi:hypothetical protein
LNGGCNLDRNSAQRDRVAGRRRDRQRGQVRCRLQRRGKAAACAPLSTGVAEA